MASKVQQDAGITNGFVFTGAAYEGGTVLGLEFIRTAGGDVLDGDSVVVDSPEAIEGLTIQQTLVSDGIAPGSVANYQEDQASGAFLRGDSVFMRMWPYAYDFLGDEQQTELTTRAGRPGAAANCERGHRAGQRRRWVQLVPQRGGCRSRCRLRADRVPDRARAAKAARDRGRVSADADGALRRPGDHQGGPRRPAGQGDRPGDDDPAGVAVLLGHVAGDVGRVQRQHPRRHVARGDGRRT